MKFTNINSALKINDKLELSSIRVMLIFPTENSEVSKLINTYFASSKLISKLDDETGMLTVEEKFSLDEFGKQKLKDLIKDLKDLDALYGNRILTVNEFQQLLND